ncbi:MAG: uracil-DNA glycosylase [Acidimicrobiales bacterium]|nr:MAG: uracil-DNA glycosylase [Acidimicrobiales bacterium]
MSAADEAATELEELAKSLAECRRCPRLVEWREHVARNARHAYRGEEYWAKPVPGFGDPDARIVIVGLAPAAHGANRTGRMFTGDRSGDFLFSAMYAVGLASAPMGRARDDGLRLLDAWLTAAVRCAPPQNKPTPDERDRCSEWLLSELELLVRRRVYVCLGKFAHDALCRALGVSPRPRFAHGAEHPLPDGRVLMCSFHPSQQNTFTGKLTQPMLRAVLRKAKVNAARYRGG